MGFKVIKDNVHKPSDNYTLVGREYQGYQGGKHRIRLLDDDGNIYLYLLSDADYVVGNADEETLFAPLDYFEGMYGCVDLQYKKEDGVYTSL